MKAFNTLPAAILASDPAQNGGRRVLFLSGNQQEAKSVTASLIERLGFAPIDLGSLSDGGRLQQFGAVFPTVNLIKLN